MQRTVRLNAIAAATWLLSAAVLIPATQRGQGVVAGQGNILGCLTLAKRSASPDAMRLLTWLFCVSEKRSWAAIARGMPA